MSADPRHIGEGAHSGHECFTILAMSEQRPERYAPITAGEWTVSNITAACSCRTDER